MGQKVGNVGNVGNVQNDPCDFEPTGEATLADNRRIGEIDRISVEGVPMADVLFLLKPGFADAKAGSVTYYCPPCATVRGVLGYYPTLWDVLEVKEVDFPRPRAEVAAVLGEKHPGCPVLVLDDGSTVPDGVKVHTAPTGKRYLDGPTDIGNYFAAKYGVSAPHP